MKTQPVALSPEQQSLFVSQCDPCSRFAWCHRSAERQCKIPDDDHELARFWQMHRERSALAGGTAPKALPPVRCRPRLGKVTHIHPKVRFPLPLSNAQPVGVYAKDVVGQLKAGFGVRPALLEKRGLSGIPKVLVISAKDDWLVRFCRHVDEPFARSILSDNFTAVMGPNLSGYHHTEHFAWLDNRSICQQFAGFALRFGLPAIFHTYLEHSPIHQDWLVEYFNLNPSQHFLATGFDRQGCSNPKFVRARVKLLAAVEERIGRPLHIVFHTLMTRLNYVKLAHDAFPQRVYLLAQSVVLRSVKGSSLSFTQDGRSAWKECDPTYSPGVELFNHNTRRLDEALADFVPGFFENPRSSTEF